MAQGGVSVDLSADAERGKEQKEHKTGLPIRDSSGDLQGRARTVSHELASDDDRPQPSQEDLPR